MADWEQLEGESKQHYSWFLAYRNLGPTRTLDRAYQVTKGDQEVRAPGPWATASSRYRWVERAAAWDVDTLSEAGARVVSLFVAAMEQLALQTIAGLQAHTPRNFGEALAGMEALGALVPADTVEAAQQTAAARAVPAIGGQGPGISIEAEPIE
jgi:hypothetical protein